MNRWRIAIIAATVAMMAGLFIWTNLSSGNRSASHEPTTQTTVAPTPQPTASGAVPGVETAQLEETATIVLRAFYIPPEQGVDIAAQLQPYATESFADWLKDQWVGASPNVSLEAFNVSYPDTCGPHSQRNDTVLVTAFVEMDIKFGDEPITSDAMTAFVEFTKRGDLWLVANITELSGFVCEGGE